MRFTALVSAAATTTLAVLVGPVSAVELKVGDEAPGFELVGSDGKTYKLSDYRGKRPVVLAWFPKAFTPGCTKECKSFLDEGEDLREMGIIYFTISCDTAKVNKQFAESLEVDYPILSDPKREVALKYGVVKNRYALPQRHTFLISASGKIMAIEKAVNTSTHAADVADRIKGLAPQKSSENTPEPATEP